MSDISDAQVTAQATPAAVESTPRTGPVMIGMRGVSKFYLPEKAALADVNVDIRAGEFVFIVGHSGSGKSTFIRLLLRELLPSRGQIVVAGQDLVKLKNWKVPYLRRNIGCVFQDFKLLPNKTAFENVAFALEVIGKSRHVIRTQVPEVLRLVGLEDVRRVGVGVGEHRHTAQPHGAHRAQHAPGDLAAVGDQDLVDGRHGRPLYGVPPRR